MRGKRSPTLGEISLLFKKTALPKSTPSGSEETCYASKKGINCLKSRGLRSRAKTVFPLQKKTFLATGVGKEQHARERTTIPTTAHISSWSGHKKKEIYKKSIPKGDTCLIDGSQIPHATRSRGKEYHRFRGAIRCRGGLTHRSRSFITI